MYDVESCETCRFKSKEPNEVPCCNCTHNATNNYQPVTNADRIRSMSDFELAEWLINFKNTFGEEYEGKMSCLKWLRLNVE